MAELTEMNEAPLTAQMFGNAGLEHMKRYGTKPEHFAKIAYKNHKHSVNNPYVAFKQFICECNRLFVVILSLGKNILWIRSETLLAFLAL
jgi:acetyl-CoA acetyltransferase